MLASQIELWPIDRPVPYAKNARTHSAAQLRQLRASILEFGFTNPILVDANGQVIAGHGRLAAARDLGLTEVPVVILDHLSAKQRQAYVIADNKLALNAGWDPELLKLELADLQLAGVDLELLGFDDDELGEILGDGEFEGQDDDHDPDDPTLNQDQALAIVLSPEEQRQWRAAKARLQLSTDKAAFWSLVTNYLDVES